MPKLFSLQPVKTFKILGKNSSYFSIFLIIFLSTFSIFSKSNFYKIYPQNFCTKMVNIYIRHNPLKNPKFFFHKSPFKNFLLYQKFYQLIYARLSRFSDFLVIRFSQPSFIKISSKIAIKRIFIHFLSISVI